MRFSGRTNPESKRLYLAQRREAKKATMENSGLRSDLTTRLMVANSVGVCAVLRDAHTADKP